MKKATFILLLVGCLFLLSGFSFGNDGIDRSETIKFPNATARVDQVYVCLKSGYAYHNSNTCSTEKELLGIDRKSFVEITEYEAIMRGFFECPDCSDRAEYADVLWIDEIHSMLDDLYDAIFGYE